MVERATLRLDSGREVRVEVDAADLGASEIVVRRSPDDRPARAGGLLAAIDAHLASSATHPAGTTDRLLQADRDRRY